MIMKSVKMNGLYILDGRTIIGSVSNVQNQYISKTRMWHMRLGHISEKGLQELSKKKLLGDDKLEPLGFCEQCVYGKAKLIKFETGLHQTKLVLDYVHSDL